MKNILSNKKLWLSLFLLSWIPTILSCLFYLAFIFSYNCRPAFNCNSELKNLALALEMYCNDHNNGCLPPASKPEDYFYWTKGITGEYLTHFDTLYCYGDEVKKDPSSYVSDPRLAGRKLSDLKKIPHLVILREREYRHKGHRAAFYGSDINGMYSKAELPGDLKYNPDLSERENRELPDREDYFNYRRHYNIFIHICLFFFWFLTVTLYILWAYSRHLNRKAENTKINPT